MKFRKDHHLLCVSFRNDLEISRLFITKILVLANKFYNEYKVSISLDDYQTHLCWRQVVLEGGDVFEAGDDSFFSMYLDCSFYKNNEGKIEPFEVRDSILIYGGYDKGSTEIFIEIYADLFTDLMDVPTYSEGESWSSIMMDNSLGAQKNRVVIRGFLENFSKVVGPAEVDFDSSYFDKEYITQYGFSDDVKHKVLKR